MITYKITEVDKWIPVEHDFIQANSHADAAKKIPQRLKRIYSDKFREIEYTGHYFFIDELFRNGKCFVFEVLTD